MDNANPVVLNLSDLPTRRGKGAQKSAKAVEVNGSPLRATLLNEVGFVPCQYDESEEELESEDDSTIDPIDELEIYGKLATDGTAGLGLSGLLLRSTFGLL